MDALQNIFADDNYCRRELATALRTVESGIISDQMRDAIFFMMGIMVVNCSLLIQEEILNYFGRINQVIVKNKLMRLK